MRALPTVMDARTIIPPRLFAPLEVLGSIGRNFVLGLQQREAVSVITRNLMPRLIVNIAIIAALLSALSVGDLYVLLLYQTFPALQIISYEIFKLILTIVVIAYPIISIFGKTEEITEFLFDSTQRRIVRTPLMTGGMHYLHRIIRNVVTGIVVLLISSFVTPSLSVITNIPIILPISSFATLAIFVYLILDTFFVINRRMERGIISSLLRTAESTKQKEVLPMENKSPGNESSSEEIVSDKKEAK
jgi:hypothetical protein